MEKATFGGGCYWCLEAIFLRVRGVLSVEPGFMGGQAAYPGYLQVCHGQTGHAEVVQLKFDPQQIGYADLLEIFFAIHNPTTLNRQGGDVGTQYRSVIFYHSAAQQRAAELSKIEAARNWAMPVVTQITEAERFWPTEADHHQYYDNHLGQPYCLAVIAPKLQQFIQQFPDRLRA